MSGPGVRGAGLVLMALLLSACTLITREEGRPVPSDLSALQTGVTTKVEALALLGAPETVERQFDGDLLTWRWRLARSRSLLIVPIFSLVRLEDGQDGEDRLSLLFDEAGLLAGLGLSRDARPGEQAAPAVVADDEPLASSD